MQEQLKAVQVWQREDKKLLAAAERLLTKVVMEKSKLEESNTRLGEELKDVRAQLADSVKENKRLQHGIFSMYSNDQLYSSAKLGTNRVMSVGMLTGRLE